nr:unnamed protein product [Callosobruchus analis]
MEVHKKRTNIHSDSTSFIASGNLKAHPPKRPETAAAYLRVCSHCNISFQSAQGLADHIVKKHPSSISTVTRKIHECTKCTYRTTISSTFKKHMAKHPDLAGMCVRISCSYCNKTFVHKKSLNDHIAKKHPDFIASVSSKVHECTECSFKTTKISNLREHMAKHPELVCRCIYCNKTFARETILNEHITKKHPDFIASVGSKIHECTKCTYKTTISSKLKEHMAKHSGLGVFTKCTYCNKTFTGKALLNEHITKKHPDFVASLSCKIHECTNCTYKTTKSSRLKEHMAKHPELAAFFRCTYCNKTFALKASLNDHIAKKHPDFIASVSCKVHECTKCSFKTARISNLKEHMAKHPELGVFSKCTYCNKTFTRKAFLNQHITNKHPDFIASLDCKIHQCTKCTYKTTRSSLLRNHMKKHPELAGKCTYCNKTFAYKISLNDHIIKKHPDFIATVSSKIHECAKCTYKTTISSKLTEHMIKHTDFASNCVLIKCTYCNKTFAHKKSLNDHITKKHPDFIASVSSKIHECTKCTYKTTRSSRFRDHMAKHPELGVICRCTYCDKTFPRKTLLNEHITKKHPDFIASLSCKVHECTKCTYKTTRSNNLKDHMAKHPELADKCSYCNKTFAHKKSLNDHIIKIHPDFIASVSGKIHECTKCAYKTTRSSHFRDHMAKHPELAAICRCTYCDETFPRKTLLNEHITKKHPDFIASVGCKVHECTKCSYKTTRSSHLKDHMAKHPELADKCTYCNKTFARKLSLNDHIIKKHPDFIASVSSKIHECTKCTYKTTRSSHFRDHMATHPELAAICRCTYCDKTFPRKTLLNNHITKKHPDFIASVSCKVHECTKCTYKTTRSSYLKDHMAKHPELADKCTYCSKTFTQKASLNEHIARKHPDFITSVSCKIYECTKCTYKTTVGSSRLTQHMMVKHPELAGNCVFSRCTYCNKTFTRKALQNEHITQKHPDFIASVSCKVHECTKCTYKTTMSGRLKEHMAKHPELAGSNHIFNRCTYCNKIFTRKSLLNEHITKQHPDFIASLSCKVHECTKCSFKTTRNSNLKGHMVVHPELVANRVVTRCPYCDETFVHKKSLNEHITKKHPDFIASLSCKVHECTKCSFKTTINSILKEHIAVHSGLVGNRVLNRCPYCDETFVHKKSLNEHITKKHPDFIATLSCKVHECTKCTYKTTMTSRLKEHMVKHPEPAQETC